MRRTIHDASVGAGTAPGRVRQNRASGRVVKAILFFLLSLSGIPGCAVLQSQTADTSPLPRPVRDACDAACAIAVSAPGVAIERSSGTFSDEAFGRPVPGCHLAISGSFEQTRDFGGVAERLRRGFRGTGWRALPEYDADGKDGTRFMLSKEGVTCLFRGEWDGGDDEEAENPGGDEFRVFVLCAEWTPPPR